MPQLMPLYWVISSIMLIMLYLMIMKIYGSSNMHIMDFKKENNEKMMSWYW